MGMGKKSAPPPAQQTTNPTVSTKNIGEAQADDNAVANKLARADENQSATLLQVKDEEQLKKQNMLG